MTSAGNPPPDFPRRVLVIDDNEAIHADFRKILTPEPMVSDVLLAAEAELFGEQAPEVDPRSFELVTADQGQVGYDRVAEAEAAGTAFAMAFVDMRMPPGWDGLETIERIWADYPNIEMVICTAFSDYSWEETVRRLGRTDRLLVVKKPFDHVEILQVACALTHKWYLQQQSAKVLDGLAKLVSDRTRALEGARDQLVLVNQELIIAKDEAEAASSAKTMFLANVSHELRTPMTAILGYAQELEELQTLGNTPSFEREAVTTIRRNADHLIGLIGDLLDVAKLESGKLTVDLVPCSPLELLAEVMAILGPKASERKLSLDVHCATPIPATIAADPLRLRQILVNLIDNAVKFTQHGGVHVHVSLVEDEQPSMVFEVVDSGVGIGCAALARVFRPFEQGDVSTTRRFGGTGLGLSISQELARLHGGNITVESEVGRGSKFRLTIATGCLDGIERIRDARPQFVATEAVSRSPEGVGAHVLLVEDGRDNQRLISHVLKKAGCTVAVAVNGVECLDQVRLSGASFDVILMDMQMPVMGGVEATEELRRRGCELPIIALTANAMPSDEQACLQAGCDAFLTKPVDRQHLIELIASKVGSPLS